MLDLIVRENTIVFLPGDFNVNLSHNNELSLDAEECTNIFFSHHLFPLINKPTRETNHTATVIDNIFCNVPSPIDISDVGIWTGSPEHFGQTNKVPTYPLLRVVPRASNKGPNNGLDQTLGVPHELKLK